MVKAVIFDMYETLITLHAAPLYFSAEMAADAGVPVEDFRRAWYPSEMDRTLGRLDLEAALRPVLEQFGCCRQPLIDLMVDKRKAAKRASFDHIHPQVIPMLQALKDKGLRIGLITNCFWEEAEYIRQSQLFPFLMRRSSPVRWGCASLTRPSTTGASSSWVLPRKSACTLATAAAASWKRRTAWACKRPRQCGI